MNIKILISVWYEYDTLVPSFARFFRPREGVWLVHWMKYQVFVPIFLLQLVNIFWSFREYCPLFPGSRRPRVAQQPFADSAVMWRILFRIVFKTGKAEDTREEGEEDEEEEDGKPGAEEKKKQ